MKYISKKSITFSIILLFIGVSISSGISIDTETTEDEDCKECKETKSGRPICDVLQLLLNQTWYLSEYYFNSSAMGILILIHYAIGSSLYGIVIMYDKIMKSLGCPVYYP